MSLEENKAVARRAMEAIDQRNMDGVIAQCALNTTWHGFSPEPLNNDGYRQAIAVFLNAFPDSRFTVEAVIAEGDKVAVQHSLHGTHNGDFQNIPPTGKSVVVPAVVIFRMEKGKIVEAWLNAELLGLLMQLGAVPA